MKSKNRDFFLEALKIQKNAKRIGFDWQKKEEIFKKIREEIRELKRAIKKGDQKMVEEEFGDLLFSLINLSRHLRINPK
ncbi:MAG: MazG nucleotide pyrophosphohydrolase domain-containing protein, partial [candidate division WOR-3 bacterium]